MINGSVGQIEAIEDLDDAQLLIRAVVNGKRVEFSTDALRDKAGRIRLSHDLAVTAYSSQGLTAETATIVLGSEYDRHQSYVAMSRARGEAHIYYDKSLLSAQAKGERELASQQQELTETAEMAYLAAKLSRANLKTSTLALSTAPEVSRTQPGRKRDTELSL